MLFRDRAEFFVTQYALTRRSTKHEHLKSFISSHSFFQLLYSNPEVENEFMKGAWGRVGICPHQWGSIWWRWHWGLYFRQHDLFILFNCIIWSPYSVDQFSDCEQLFGMGGHRHPLCRPVQQGDIDCIFYYVFCICLFTGLDWICICKNFQISYWMFFV